jgi:type IV pilus assembly protein PilE
MHSSPRLRRLSGGFTLIEMLVATSVSGLLASVAYPSFSGAIQKVRRTEALVAMVQIEQAEERWRSGSSRYGTLAELGLASVAPGGSYLLSVADAGTNGYVALAQATGAQAGDHTCRYLKLSIASGNLVYSSGETAAATNGEQANRQCWNQ